MLFVSFEATSTGVPSDSSSVRTSTSRTSPCELEYGLHSRSIMKLLEIIISCGHDYWVRSGEPTRQHGTLSPMEVRCEAGWGLVGDRYFYGKPGRKGQVTFMDQAVVDAIRKQFSLPSLPASLFRRNLIVAGLSLPVLLGKRFELQGVEFEGAQECRPCEWMDRVIANGVREFMRDNFRGGLRAKVLTSGTLRVEGARPNLAR